MPVSVKAVRDQAPGAAWGELHAGHGILLSPALLGSHLGAGWFPAEKA